MTPEKEQAVLRKILDAYCNTTVNDSEWQADLHDETIKEALSVLTKALEEAKQSEVVEFEKKIQECYTEVWKTQVYPVSSKGKDKGDDIIKKHFPFVKA